MRLTDHEIRERDERIDALQEEVRRLQTQVSRLIDSNEEYAQELATRWRWLDSTYLLQREVYGKQYPLATDQQRVDSIKENAFAAFKELSELTDEIGWKPWAKDGGWIRREHVLKEAVDVGHFLANILCTIDVSDREWEEAYRAKQRVNRERQRLGYDGVSGKCPGCKRAYDDGILCKPAIPGSRALCDVRHAFIDEE